MSDAEDEGTKEEFNYCVWKYLLESGLEHSAFLFARESGLDESSVCDRMDLVPRGALMKLVDMSVEYTKQEMREHTDIDIDIDNLGIFEAANILGNRPGNVCVNAGPPSVRDNAETSDESDDEEMDEDLKRPVITEEIKIKDENIYCLDGHGYQRAILDVFFHPTDNDCLVSTCILNNPGCIIWNLNTSSDIWLQDTLMRSSVEIKYDLDSDALEELPEVTCGAWSNKHHDLLAVGDDQDCVRIFDRTGFEVATTEISHACSWVNWSPANAPGMNILAVTDFKGTIHFYNMDDPVHGLEKPMYTIGSFHCAPGQVLFRSQAEGSFIVKNDKQVLLFDIMTSRDPVRVFEGHTDWIFEAALHPSGNIFASGSTDTTVKLWNIEQKNAIRTFEHKDRICRCKFSSDERTLAAISLGTGIFFYDLESGRTIKSIINLPQCEQLEFAPNGQFVAIGGKTGQVFIYETTNFELVRALEKGEVFSRCTDVAWSPDSKKLVGGYSDGSILLFDMRR